MLMEEMTTGEVVLTVILFGVVGYALAEALAFVLRQRRQRLQRLCGRGVYLVQCSRSVSMNR